ncbi:MAG: hypothetical protein CMM61_18000 [Rhodospirillaceae bacterium]|nr:hypothetical protein [Rhodospirillaceae bacterium]|tara:strand:+ start:116 stop:502 length:387 start_codon:yes stop_codon:yes gene_type:complete
MIGIQTDFYSGLIPPIPTVETEAAIASSAPLAADQADRLDLQESEARGIEGPERRSQFATFVRDPEIVNQILEDTQGLDRYRQRQEELLRQASLVTDAYERSVFISMIDPGRAMTVLGTREDMKLIES